MCVSAPLLVYAYTYTCMYLYTHDVTYNIEIEVHTDTEMYARTKMNTYILHIYTVKRKNIGACTYIIHTHTSTYRHQRMGREGDRGGEEKLGAVGVRARIGHRQKSGHRVLDEALVELILEFLACIYRYVSRYISI